MRGKMSTNYNERVLNAEEGKFHSPCVFDIWRDFKRENLDINNFISLEHEF